MNRASAVDTGCRNLRWALALLDGLMIGGMRQLVLSPGSRSTPLVLAAQRRPGLGLTPILDERSAAFFALGLARASRRPVGLLCTSGSAPAHWFPAVIEASESGVGLILLSADRPPELRGWGANQTIDQTRLFGGFVRELHDPGPPDDSPAAFKALRALGARAAAVSLGNRPGPVHINLPFREPLVPEGPCGDTTETVESAPARPPLGRTPFVAQDGLPRRLGGRGLICCGPGAASPGLDAALWRCAERLGLPVLVDPLSNLRFGAESRHRITRYDSFLRNPGLARALKPDWALRIGRAPVSKTLIEWLDGIPAILVDPAERWADPTHDAVGQVAADPGVFCEWLTTAGLAEADPGWIDPWVLAEQRLDRLAADHLGQSPWCEGHLIVDLLDRLVAGDGLLVANSLPVRQLDTWSGTRAGGLSVFGNRGASGIDGQLSTLAGLNAGGTPTTGLLGDLSFLHDLSGLLLARRLDRPCIVLNNGGGRIFDYLPQRGLPGFDALWRTPVRLELGSLARTFGIAHREVEDAAGFRQALADALDARPGGVIEVHVDAERSRRVHLDFWRLVRDQELLQA